MNMNLRYFLLSIVVWSSLALPTAARTDTGRHNLLGVYLVVPLEFPVIRTAALDAQLLQNGYTAAKYHTANIGLGIQLYSNHFITTFSFNKSTKRSDQDTYLTEVEYRSTTLNFGYSVFKNQWVSAYPYIGFKGSGLNYLYKEKIPDPGTFVNYLQANLKHMEITNSRAHLDLGVGLAHHWFYLVNFRFGYLVPLEKVRWNINNNQTPLANAPAISYPYYFSLSIGFGTMVSDKDR